MGKDKVGNGIDSLVLAQSTVRSPQSVARMRSCYELARNQAVDSHTPESLAAALLADHGLWTTHFSSYVRFRLNASSTA